MKTSQTLIAPLSLALFATLAPAALAAPAPRPQEPAPAQEKLPTMAQAAALMEKGDFKAAAEAYGKIAAARPDDADAVFNHGYALHLSGDLKAAHDRHLEAAKFPEYRAVALYNHACVHALWKDIDLTIQSLQEALDAGFGKSERERGLLATDTDLDSVRQDPRFAVLVASVMPMPKLSSLAPERLFDFYAGEWDMLAGDAVESIVRVTPAFGGRGWRVSMTNPGDEVETATSVYTYDTAAKAWRQTWVNDAGQTITMKGGLEGEALALRVETDTTGTAMDGRSVFSEVTRNSFVYAWQRTEDGGKTWTTVASRTFRRRG